MKAILLKQYGGPEELYLGEVPNPELGEHEVLVQIHATALNRADVMQRQGKYPPPPGTTDILGLEMAGKVIAIGSHESRWNPGDKVCGLLSGGGYAQQVASHEMMLMPIPWGLSYTEAAAIPEVFLTAYQALSWLAKLQRGETICIHAGASGVGTAAIQLAKQIGAKVIVTASQQKHALCKSLGADYTIDYKNEDFQSRIMEYTDGVGVDVLIDFIAAPYFQKNLNSMALDGRMVMLSLMGGVKVEDVNLVNILRKRIHIMGSTLRSRNLHYKIQLTTHFTESYLGFFEERKLKPIIDRVYGWTEVSEAHAYMESNQNKGKIVLTVEQ